MTSQSFSGVPDDPAATGQVKSSSFRQSYGHLGPEALARKMWDEIRLNLIDDHIATSRMTQNRFWWLFPRGTTSDEQMKIFQQILDTPMLLSDQDLCKVLDLEQCIDSSQTMQGEGHKFYIRTWAMKQDQLKAVISYLSHEDNTFEELQEWLNIMELNQPHFNAGGLIHVRYIGMCQPPTVPLSRLLEDQVYRAVGVLADFHSALGTLFPDVSQSAKVHMIKDATIDWKKCVHNADDVERVLIEYFESSSLLNRQRGGWFPTYVPSIRDASAFESLQSNFYRRALDSVRGPPTQIKVQLAELFARLYDVANALPQDTGADKHPFTLNLKDSLLRQATPRVNCKFGTLMVWLGKDITLQDYMLEVGFLDGESRAASLAKIMLEHLARSELSSLGYSDEWYGRFDSEIFCFYDLWPWIKHEDLIVVVDLLREFLSITRPLIVNTFSRPVNHIIRANLVHQMGLPQGAFTDHVGELTIQYYDPPDWTVSENASPDPNTAFINIPHIHPGRDKYGSQEVELRRVIFMTMQLSFLVGSIALDVNEQQATSPYTPTRLALCQLVLQKVKFQLESTESGREWKDKFENAKIDLKKHFAKQVTKISYASTRSAIGLAGDDLLAAFGFAVGQPHSNERKQDLIRLWNCNVAELHLMVPHEEERRFEWMHQFMTLQQGQSYYLAVSTQLPEDQHVQELVRTMRPSWATHDGWLRDTELGNKTQLSCGLFFHKHDIATKSGRRHNIGVSNMNGQFIIRWLQNNDVKTSLRLTAACAKTSKSTDIRSVHFTCEGIDIVDGQGHPLRPLPIKGVSPKATIPRTRFPTLEQGDVITELWNLVTKHLGLIPDEIVEDEATWEGAKGVDRVRRNVKDENPLQNRPPQRMDANWLLKTFIDERFPSGGTFRTSLRSDNPSSTEDLAAFVAFLKRPEYRKHPFTETWLAEFDTPRPNVQVLDPNLWVLRSMEKVKIGRWNKERKQTVQETTFNLGPPGSARPWAERANRVGDVQAREKRTQQRTQKKTKREAQDEDEDESAAGPSQKRGKNV
ncbi:hypothetical protein SUNI508_01470 [Seiridium unicorne]|uniref:Uncharacterized protein n=1 Tax=Seiridium unicorne TaxID=138068 RepID=A0ABR2UST5_9PEZI